MATFDPKLKSELDAVIRKLEALPGVIAEKRKDILEYAAIPIVDAASSLAPMGTRVHYTYDTPKADRGKRAAKGSGRIRGTYYPGNLRKAVNILRKLRQSSAVFVGQNETKSGKGAFGQGVRVNAFYAAMVEYGTQNMAAKPFMRPGFAKGGPQAKRRIELGLIQLMRKYKQGTGL